jgi:hypothetical protein
MPMRRNLMRPHPSRGVRGLGQVYSTAQDAELMVGSLGFLAMLVGGIGALVSEEHRKAFGVTAAVGAVGWIGGSILFATSSANAVSGTTASPAAASTGGSALSAGQAITAPSTPDPSLNGYNTSQGF